MGEFYTNICKYGNRLLYRGNKNGRRVQEEIKFKPTLFLKTTEDTIWKSLSNIPVKPKVFNSMSEANDFVDTYSDVVGFDVFGLTDYEYQYLIKKFPDEIEYDLSKFSIVSLDIETEIPEDGSFPDVLTANVPITLISVQKKGEKRITSFGYSNYSPTNEVDLFGCSVDYKCYANEEKMLLGFINWWCSDYPDIITSWNGDSFDIPFIINRIIFVLGEAEMKRMSPWGMVRPKNIEVRGKEIQVYVLQGITQLDYLQLYKKFSFTPQESYTLGHVASEELGVTKLEYSGTFREFYSNNWNTFVEYNLRDVQLVDMLDEKFKFIELCIQIAYMAKCNISDVFSPVKTWDIFIYSYLHSKNIAIPFKKNNHSDGFEGAWVKDPILGMKHWIMSFDATSLYPNVIRQWNISPEKKSDAKFDLRATSCLDKTEEFIESSAYAKSNNLTLAANGATFTRDSIGFLPNLMQLCLSGRKIAKKEMLILEQEYQKTKDHSLKSKIAALNGKQMALKILANSVFGACGQKGFRYFDLELAEAITLSGQWCNKSVMAAVNDYLNSLLNTKSDYIITGDTDSVVGDTLILVNGEKIKISDFYDSFINYSYADGDTRSYVKPVNSSITPSVSKDGVLEYSEIKYVMKHAVKKVMFKITVGNESVTVTEDHSIIIERNGSLLSVSPMEILPDDTLINIA
jgi:DNA polymerase elongation subunit (family B)